jgi:hypothetical protein
VHFLSTLREFVHTTINFAVCACCVCVVSGVVFDVLCNTLLLRTWCLSGWYLLLSGWKDKVALKVHLFQLLPARHGW